MENSYRFFENRDCAYFPCHKGLEHFNCLFCYCPFYFAENCGGNNRCPGAPRYIEMNGKCVKDCTDCIFPHRPENYDNIMALLAEMNRE